MRVSPGRGKDTTIQIEMNRWAGCEDNEQHNSDWATYELVTCMQVSEEHASEIVNTCILRLRARAFASDLIIYVALSISIQNVICWP